MDSIDILVTLMAGQSAYDSETMSKEDLVQEALETLALIHPHIKHIPKPVETVVTRWSQDEFAKGSYSFVGKDGTGDDYDLMAKPVDGQLYFAGEATSRHYPATAHGAYLSGIKVAKDVLDSLIGAQVLDWRTRRNKFASAYGHASLTNGTARRESSQSSNDSKRSHLLTLEEAHTSDSPPPEKYEALLGHGFAIPRRRGRAARSMMARFVAEQSDGGDGESSNGESYDDGARKKPKGGEMARAATEAPLRRGPGRPRKTGRTI